MGSNKSTPGSRPRLSAEDWTLAGFKTFTNDGWGAVSIESLAKQLGATRGSFYWHFSSHAELLESILGFWKRGAIEAQDRLRQIPDPRQRLRTFLAEGIADTDYGKREIDLLSHMDNPSVRSAVEEHTLTRTKFVEEALVQAGHNPTEAATEAIQSWALWIGAYQLATTMPALVPGETREEKLTEATRSLLSRILED